MTTPQTAQALADEAKWLAETYGDTRIMASRGRATREEVIEAGAEFRSTIDNLLALATQADTERANWKRWCELAEAATQAEAPACPDPAGCLREGCNQNGDGSLCERYVEPEAPAAPAQATCRHPVCRHTQGPATTVVDAICPECGTVREPTIAAPPAQPAGERQP